jgi:acyl-[acyl-carrier-protein] desaturase
MVLDMWLERSGKRTEDQIADFERSLLGAEWKLPFESPRQMICYTMIQELATGVNYTNLRERAESEGDVCLARVLRWVAADESAHYNFFRKGVKAFMELDPEGTVKDIKWVFDHFTMPAHALIPEWDERGQVIEEAGVYGPKVYLGKVRRPVIEDLALTREQLRGTGLTDAEVQEIADKEDERQEALRLGMYKRFTTIATSPRYQHPQRTVISTIP